MVSSSGDDPGGHVVHDGVQVPTRGARVWAGVAAVCAVVAVWVVPVGVLGMVGGTVAHLKGDRWGMPVAVLAGVTTIVGMALVFFVRLR